MFTVGRRRTARLAAAVLASGLFAAGAISGAGSALADDPAPAAGGATATLGQLTTFDRATINDGANSFQVEAGLFQMSVTGGGTIYTYCIDLHDSTQPQAQYQEVPWASSSLGVNPNSGKIEWILHHSYPQINDLQQLAQEAGSGPLTPQLAAAGTQVAIWRYSDNADATANNSAAEKLADYLTKTAQTTAEPQASLNLTPPAVSGKSGTRIGPVTVHTNAASAQVGLSSQSAGSGVTVVDKNGKPVTSAADGEQLYFNVPSGTPAGSATLDVQATTAVPVGRVFKDVRDEQTGKQASQLQILAGSSDSTVSAQATATWAKQGAIPAVSAMVDCAKSGVDVTATNQGDEAFDFQLAGKEYTVAAGKSQTITVPVAEGQSYAITITGPGGFKKTFSGVLNCKTAGSGGSSASPAPAPTPAGGHGKNLAETGSSDATPYLAGAAVVLVAIGGGMVFFLRKRKTTSARE
ncbi:Cys-Gln thioester bond-forming surface protein [Streptomyces sp. RB6PN25]|uniref:Cys-Gln thioester bond-forming surface protein n=1 Tax=Streptomyces humicola TaxID=2953240 RepID=A0ABT1PW16_9ACTN|nr:LAETG motif-containing sortase-dependent surface protein [Streptomyces humicola]MCQ4081855.1 Cys-Gln thioester bond-forming surface protein [Streptomyces humicola]